MTRQPPLHQFQITKQKERFKLSFVHRGDTQTEEIKLHQMALSMETTTTCLGLWLFRFVPGAEGLVLVYGCSGSCLVQKVWTFGRPLGIMGRE